MRALVPLYLTALFLAGLALGDKTPILNAYELVRHSGAAFLPQAGTYYIADYAKLGGAAFPVAWGVWIIASAVLAYITARIWNFIS